ncbi:unnamed protein product [Didymodactylos carnosus]|uniref:Uncharacterized protein n=1 Tax=Didymodactylos carnosus TaxID=1234261 RepID=A0A814QBM9_9BILA|nr:unnamed protein product [Didymodactylos carnosus]CAF3881548.1 unnamed protein product [Didymodactylos carnosus]
MIVIGAVGAAIGIFGMCLFRGYQHDHNIKHEIIERRKSDFAHSARNHLQHLKTKSSSLPTIETIKYSMSMVNQPQSNDTSSSRTNQMNSNDNDEFEKSRIYATLHALCLHSFVVLLESLIALVSGLLNKFVPNHDYHSGKEINLWLKYVDPSLALIMVIIIVCKAVPVVWSLGHILTEAVPAGINTDQLMKTILKDIPQIKSLHNVHVWRITARDIFATLHVVCMEDVSLSVCRKNIGCQLQKIFEKYCIRYFTLQVEYINDTEDIVQCVYGIKNRKIGHASSATNKGNKEIMLTNFSIEML